MLPLAKQDIQVVIIDGSNRQKCDGYCGLDWSSAETIRQANERIKAIFGDRVKLKFLDLSQPGESNQEPPPKVSSQELSRPLLLINGEVRISGQFDIRMLLDAISAEIEIKQAERGEGDASNKQAG